MKKENKGIHEIQERPHILEELEESVKRNMTGFAKASFVDRYPDVRDGLKPVARRIIFAMIKEGLTVNGGTVKCAKIVGDVIGSYHPHGDISAYGALVALAQPFTSNYPLIKGQGNFGNALGDSEAAYRYTECKMGRYSPMLTRDLNDNVVEFVPTFDRKLMEPSVLPSIVPNLLINGNYTIGGAAFNSSIPSHNLKDVCNLVIEFIQNPNMTSEDVGKRLMPDFPKGGIITNPEQVREYYVHGTPASIKMCGKYRIDETKREIHITELPYLVDGNHLRDDINRAFPKPKEVGIDTIVMDADRDSESVESDVIIIYLKGTDPYKLVELLKAKTKLTSTSQLMFTCVINGKLMVDCTIKEMLVEWLMFRRMVVRKTLTKNIQESYRKAHILEARIRVYEIIRKIMDYISKLNEKDVVPYLMQTYGFTVLQAEAISCMQVKELTKDSKDALISQYNSLMNQMNVYRSQLNDQAIDQIIINEQRQAIKDFGRPRRTQLLNMDGTQEDEVPGEDVIISLNSGSSMSVIRSNFLVEGFTGKSLAPMKDPNFKRKLYKYNTKDDWLFAVSNLGFIYRVDLVKSHIEAATVAQAKWSNLALKISPRLGEEIMELLPIPKIHLENGVGDILVINQDNRIKRMSVKNIPTRIQKNGAKFIPIVEGDANGLVRCMRYTNLTDDDLVFYANNAGQYHMYPLGRLAGAGKISSGASGTPSQYPIVDIIAYKPGAEVFVIAGDGSYTCRPSGGLKEKLRTSTPERIDSRITGKTRQKSLVGLGVNELVLVTDLNGWFKVVHFGNSSVDGISDCIDAAITI